MIRYKNKRYHPIAGFKNYFVNRRSGEIFSAKTRSILKPHKNATGYLRVTLYRNGFYWGERFFIHRLVASTFIKNPERKPEVNHKDFDITNNGCKNLEWVTSKENKEHRRNKKAFGSNTLKKRYNHEEAKVLAGTPF